MKFRIVLQLCCILMFACSRKSQPVESAKQETFIFGKPEIISLYRKFEKIDAEDTLALKLLHTGELEIVSDEETTTTILLIDTLKNALRTETQTTMSSWSSISDYKAFITTSDVIFLYVGMSGHRGMKNHDGIEVYRFKPATNIFQYDSVSVRALHVTYQEFFKPGTPDSVLQHYRSRTEVIPHIYYAENGTVSWSLWGQWITISPDDKWLLGDEIFIEFNGKEFTKSQPQFINPVSAEEDEN